MAITILACQLKGDSQNTYAIGSKIIGICRYSDFDPGSDTQPGLSIFRGL